MRVHQLMSQPPESCRPSSDLAAVAMIMWRQDCGIVPVVDQDDRLLGVVTDRDICMAVATRHRRAEELTAAEVMHTPVISVESHQDVREAMRLMAENQIRRLPVLYEDGRIAGMLSANDLMLEIRLWSRSGSEPTTHDVIEMLRAISAHPRSVSLAESPSPLQPAI